jgi:chemotaxis protein CheZ
MELSKNLYSKLSDLTDKTGNKVQLQNLDSLVSDLLSLFSAYAKNHNVDLYNEIKTIENKIHSAKTELTCRASKKDTVLACANSELGAVIETTEEATNKIIDSAENIQKIVARVPDKQLSNEVTNNVMVIFEACNFQDLTGQRIKKVSTALDFIENSVGHILEKYSFEDIKQDSRADANLMAGPQATKNTPDQSDIDKLFDSA